jgi:hypothetical protein
MSGRFMIESLRRNGMEGVSYLDLISWDLWGGGDALTLSGEISLTR